MFNRITRDSSQFRATSSERDPFGRALSDEASSLHATAAEGAGEGQSESAQCLDDLYYRLEGRRLRLAFLEQAGAPRGQLQRERADVERMESRIQLRIRAIQVQRNLDEKLLFDEVQRDPSLAHALSCEGSDELAECVVADDRFLYEGLEIESAVRSGGGAEVVKILPGALPAAGLSLDSECVERVVTQRITQLAVAGVARQRA